MKRVLIIGETSYLGKSLRTYLERFPEEYYVDTLSVRTDTWKRSSFENVDAIYYVAALVHIKENSVSEEEWFRVNAELPVKVARKAKDEKVKQFIFVSTMSVYGLQSGCIDKNSLAKPVTAYGKSKLRGEEELKGFCTEEFAVVILRPPMIYGKDCKGNFSRLKKLALKCSVFPRYDNKRSMLYIENLNILVEQVIKLGLSGTFCPQDKHLINTWEMVKLIRTEKGKRLLGVRIFNPIIRGLQKHLSVFEKIWGNLYYSQTLSQVEGIEYQIFGLEDALHEIMKPETNVCEERHERC